MLKLKFFKTILEVSFFLVLLFFAFDEVYAFFSPNTLQLLTASVGSGIWQAIVFLLVTIVSLGIRIKNKNIRRIGLVVLFLGLTICLVLGSSHFYKLKGLNQLLSLNESEFAKIYERIDIPTDRFINLNKIDQLEYDSFKKVNLVRGQNIKLFDTTTAISLFKLKEIMMINKTEEYLQAHGIAKEDKVLAYCNFGWSSSLAAYFLNKLGYNVYYTKLNKLESKDYIEFDRFPLTGTWIPIIAPLEREKSDRHYIVFMFHEVEDEFCDPEVYSQDIRNLLKKIVIWPEETSKKEQCHIPEVEFGRIFAEHSKIVCLNKLDCILTQHYIDYLSLTKQFPKIFFIES